MSGEKISVLIVDDSALMRNLIGRIVEHEPDLQVVGKAMNGAFALAKLDKLDPDVIILDLEMPEMNGIEFLRERVRRNIQIPVIILSSHAEQGAHITMEAISLGASDFILKPTGGDGTELQSVQKVLVEMIRAYGGKYKKNRSKPIQSTVIPGVTSVPSTKDTAAGQVRTSIVPPTPAPSVERMVKPPIPRKAPGPIEIVAIGVSTGGPNALREVFPKLDPNFPVPIVVVQHMPPGFTEEFAKSLDRICALEVKEASEGDILRPGRILIAPGNRHIVVEKKPLAAVVHLLDTPPVNGHRPSADVLFESVARQYGNRALAVIMTGMGKDGATQIGAIYREGGITIGQDEESCIVYGMPRVAFENGFIQYQVSLSKMAETINKLVREYA
ncbi:MAG: chemotaxis response regulator protein-glutamate methylesterase [Spirochaetes bacterium]|nr:chemotaxis response regulator protein-glutamate methylesterase [Spirochaetota bacterium]